MPNVHSGKRGDQFVTVKVITPTKLTKRQKELLTEFGLTEKLDSGGTFFDKFRKNMKDIFT